MTLPNDAQMLAELTARLGQLGLSIRGKVLTEAGESLGGERQAIGEGTLILVGHTGSSLWPVFSASAEYQDDLADPLDRWSQRIGDALAGEFHAEALYPFDGPPWHPFLEWTQRAGTTFPSPTGLAIDPQAGLWHALRFALWFDRPLSLPNAQAISSPCHTCAERPCLSTCPVNAFSEEGYKVDACVEYLRQDPECACLQRGCLARHACPVGQTYAYQPQHAAFHMQAFASAQSR